MRKTINFITYLSFLKGSQLLLLALFLVKGPPTVWNDDQHLMAMGLAVLRLQKQENL